MKNFQLPNFYPITDARLSGLSHQEQVKELIAGGAKIIQLREKHFTPRNFFAEVVKAIEVARDENVKIIINDRVDIALAAGSHGVHLGQTDLPPGAARKILGEQVIIGFSTHSVEQAIAAASLPIDYIAIGPIFSTITKENPDATVGLEGLRRVRAAVKDFPLVAIGGITKENARSVIEAGADSIAVISALLKKNKQIADTAREFLQEINFG